MGLADLKKNSTPSKQTAQLAISIDEFIDDFIDGANLYAMGLPSQKAEVIDIASMRHEALRQRPSGNISVADAVRAATSRLEAAKKTSQFRKATFSLTEQAIAHLAEMASDCDIAKSRLLRILIENHYLLSAEERHRLEQLLQVD
ncbi:CopG family transcriptional regulator [Shewanella sp. JM162201]|uniref:CopG family transcriptional regulator n=1 Tax=Shewanella jiangmenensis TaxID=2837387 RepID=A0ABS5V4X1_9GAMM|nr:CopG family transcriptional regulator [Shewanella jiangmenensis]MBT1444890.1 CopG family transcriptional regulator [Shewanella jiangmenensis]